jgi:hypothetical protein
MQDNDVENLKVWHECGPNDGLWDIHAYEIESKRVTLQRPPLNARAVLWQWIPKM